MTIASAESRQAAWTECLVAVQGACMSLQKVFEGQRESSQTWATKMKEDITETETEVKQLEVNLKTELTACKFVLHENSTNMLRSLHQRGRLPISFQFSSCLNVARSNI